MKKDLVAETLEYWRQVPFKYGNEDCLMSIANYLHVATGTDHGARYRGKYNDENGAAKFVAEHGGMVRMMMRTGLDTTEKPKRGNVAIVVINGVEVAGICTGDAVALRLLRGVAEINSAFVTFVKIWKVPQCRL